MAYTLTDSFSFNPFCQHSSLLTSSIFVPQSSIHLLKFLSNITPIFTFFTHQYKAESASFLPKQPSLWFFWRDRPPAFLYIMSSSFLSHSCLTNIETWPLSVPTPSPKISTSQTIWFPFWSVWLDGYPWVKVPCGHGAHILNASNCCARFDIH